MLIPFIQNLLSWIAPEAPADAERVLIRPLTSERLNAYVTKLSHSERALVQPLSVSLDATVI